MAFRSEIDRATDLEAVLTGPWDPPRFVNAIRIPFVIVVAVAVALFPFSLSGEVFVLAVVVAVVLVVGAVGVVLFVLRWKAGSRIIGYSARGVYAPDLQPWDRIERVHTGNSSPEARVISVEGVGSRGSTPSRRRDVDIPSTVTEYEYRAFVGALRAEAKARGIPTVR
jgi:hypothetical protein